MMNRDILSLTLKDDQFPKVKLFSDSIITLENITTVTRNYAKNDTMFRLKPTKIKFHFSA